MRRISRPLARRAGRAGSGAGQLAAAASSPSRCRAVFLSLRAISVQGRSRRAGSFASARIDEPRETPRALRLELATVSIFVASLSASSATSAILVTHVAGEQAIEEDAQRRCSIALIVAAVRPRSARARRQRVPEESPSARDPLLRALGRARSPKWSASLGLAAASRRNFARADVGWKQARGVDVPDISRDSLPRSNRLATPRPKPRLRAAASEPPH